LSDWNYIYHLPFHTKKDRCKQSVFKILCNCYGRDSYRYTKYTLSTSVKQLLQSIEQATVSNENTNQNASNASLGCEQNLQYIENANTTVANISDALEYIWSKTQKLFEISQDTSIATEENEKIIKQTVSYMEDIELSAKQNKNIINSLRLRKKKLVEL